MPARINTIPDIVRVGFFERFSDQIIPEPNSGCWIWLGTSNTLGYGVITIFHRPHGAHRVSYECARGPIQAGLEIDHLCRVTYCVNPAHLEAVTPAENRRRQHQARRKPEFKSQDVCANGHPWTVETEMTQHNGTRACVLCQRKYDREYQMRKRLMAVEA